MRLTGRSLVVSLGLVLAFSGCGHDEVSAGDITGDWMICEDEMCSRLDNNGWRFAPGGMARELRGHDGPAIEPVCVEPRDGPWSYKFEGGVLTLQDGVVPQRRISARAEVKSSILTWHDVPAPSTGGVIETVRMRRVTTVISAFCPGSPPPMP